MIKKTNKGDTNTVEIILQVFAASSYQNLITLGKNLPEKNW